MVWALRRIRMRPAPDSNLRSGSNAPPSRGDGWEVNLISTAQRCDPKQPELVDPRYAKPRQDKRRYFYNRQTARHGCRGISPMRPPRQQWAGKPRPSGSMWVGYEILQSSVVRLSLARQP